MSGLHKDQVNSHRPYADIYADEAARLAADGFDGAESFVADDLHKKVYQESDDTEWVLTGFSPITWVQSGGVGGGGGETNVGANVGTEGVGVYENKTGVTLNFRNVTPGDSTIDVQEHVANNTIEVSAVTGTSPGTVAEGDAPAAAVATHEADTTAHPAEDVTFDPASTVFVSTDVQGALGEISDLLEESVPEAHEAMALDAAPDTLAVNSSTWTEYIPSSYISESTPANAYITGGGRIKIDYSGAIGAAVPLNPSLICMISVSPPAANQDVSVALMKNGTATYADLVHQIGGLGGNQTIGMVIPVTYITTGDAVDLDEYSVCLKGNGSFTATIESFTFFLEILPGIGTTGTGHPFSTINVDLLDPHADYSDLNSAISAASANDVIVLGPGTYTYTPQAGLLPTGLRISGHGMSSTVISISDMNGQGYVFNGEGLKFDHSTINVDISTNGRLINATGALAVLALDSMYISIITSSGNVGCVDLSSNLTVQESFMFAITSSGSAFCVDALSDGKEIYISGCQFTASGTTTQYELDDSSPAGCNWVYNGAHLRYGNETVTANAASIVGTYIT